MPSDLLILHSMAADIIYRLRCDFEKSGLPGHITLMISLIFGYLSEYPGRFLIPTKEVASGLAPDFVKWLKQNPPPGGGDDGEELRDWIRNYPSEQTEKA